MDKYRFVLDTNLLISGLLSPQTVPRQTFLLAQSIGVILSSDDTLQELSLVLKRSKFDKYVSIDHRLDFFAGFVGNTACIKVESTVSLCRDQKDDKFLSLALAGKATCIVSGDQDLLQLNPFKKIPIITANRFVKVYTPQGGQ